MLVVDGEGVVGCVAHWRKGCEPVCETRLALGGGKRGRRAEWNRAAALGADGVQGLREREAG